MVKLKIGSPHSQKKENMLKKRNLLFIFFVFTIGLNTSVYAYPNTSIQQQKKQISGRVLDQYGESIIGANIVEEGTTNGTISDIDGNFSLQIENDANLHVSYIGYFSQNIPMSEKQP